MKFDYIKAPLNQNTFSIRPIREWVENECEGLTLNLFCGKTKLNIYEIRNDIDPKADSDYKLDAFDFFSHYKTPPLFNTILLDPPYSYRKSMELYGGRKNSRFKLVKDILPTFLNLGGKVITFGYQSVSMGKSRGFILKKIALFSHGGAIHDTLASVEYKEKYYYARKISLK